MTGWIELTASAAFVAGLAGGVHCAAMCGPLAAVAYAAAGAKHGGHRWLAQALAYNAGRIASYCAAGAITGALGAAGLAFRGSPAVQQALLAIMSSTLILMAAYIAGTFPRLRSLDSAGRFVWQQVQPYSRHFLPASTAARAFGLGVVWGWIPCGMVYVALIAALTTANAVHGALLMAAFGLGTLPNLLAISAWLRAFRAHARTGMWRRIAAAAIAAVGVIGLLKVAAPSAVEGTLCLSIPGLSALPGSP